MIRAREDNPVIVIRIFGANFKLCNADCGPSLPEEELTEGVRLGLAERFGDRVKVEYHSLLNPAVVEEYRELLDKGRQAGVPLPLVTVDGAIVQGGGIDYRTILNAIEVKSESAEHGT